MEGSDREAVFDAYNLNPQLFINEVLNIVDDFVDEAFDFCHQQASELVGGDAGRDRSQELSRGISSLRQMAQATLDKRLSVWEGYCLPHCFSVPEGFSSDKTRSLPADGLSLQDGLRDAELDVQLVSLRKKLAMVGSESATLQREFCALEKQSALSNGYHASVSEVLHLLGENSVHNLFQEIEESASKLYREMEILHKIGVHKGGELKNAGGQSGERWLNSQGLFVEETISTAVGLSTKLEDLQKAADTLKLFRKP